MSARRPARPKSFPSTQIPADWEGADIGPETIAKFGAAIKGAGTVVWNGPMGIFEFSKFAEGTRGVAQALAEFRRGHHHRRRRLGGGGRSSWATATR